LAGTALHRVGPVLDPPLADAAVHVVEIVLTDQEGVVRGCDLAVRVVEIERHAVVEVDDVERSPGLRFGPAEHLGEERRRLLLVAAPDDRVVQLRAHTVMLGAPRVTAVRPGPRSRRRRRRRPYRTRS